MVKTVVRPVFITSMKQYLLEENTLTLRVKKAPLLICLIMFFFSFLFFIMPLVGMILYIDDDHGFHIGFFFGLFFFGILGFYLLRLSLWNTYGKEIITFNGKELTYIADYGWFRDTKKQDVPVGPFTFSARTIGYEEDKEGGLVIGPSEPPLFCVTKIPLEQLEELIIELGQLNH
jgi:hypothetical protein